PTNASTRASTPVATASSEKRSAPHRRACHPRDRQPPLDLDGRVPSPSLEIEVVEVERAFVTVDPADRHTDLRDVRARDGLGRHVEPGAGRTIGIDAAALR